MRFSLLRYLLCPFCGATLNGCQAARSDGEVEYDVLTCHCGEYPVVAGIPIIKKDASGETLDGINSLIKAGRQRDALLAMIVPPPPAVPTLAPPWIQSLPSVKGIRRLKRLAHEREARGWREQAIALLTDTRDGITACNLLDLYYHRSGFKMDDGYDYFALRFGQPRHLVALSLATLIEKPNKPILDLACGYGHITRSLLRRANGQPVVGIDQEFPGLHLAKNFVAPGADYICCVADGPLPFPDDFFSVAFCSDAFHYFENKVTSATELKRLTQEDGLVILVWMHNVLWRRPYDGLPLPAEGYQSLFADMPHRLVADSEVLVRYLQKKGPALACSTDIDRLTDKPLLSLVASHRQEFFREYGSFEEWPHVEGRLGLNPLFVAEKQDAAGRVKLRRTFPSAFYREEHPQCEEYLPESVTVNSQVLADLAVGTRTSAIDGLIEQLVVLGMPERYR